MILNLTSMIASFTDTLWVPKSGPDGGAKAYSVSLLAIKSDPQWAAVTEAIVKVAQDRWPETDKKTGRPLWETLLAEFKAKDRLCVHDGDHKRYEGYEGRYFLSARNARQPLVVGRDPVLRDPDGNPMKGPDGEVIPNLVHAESGIIYAGCKVNASVDIWAQDNQYGQRICAQLRWVQFVADGDAFAGAPPAKVGELVNLGMAAAATGSTVAQAAARPDDPLAVAAQRIKDSVAKPFDARSLL